MTDENTASEHEGLRNLGPTATARAQRVANGVSAVFADAHYLAVSPSVVTHADIFLDRLGERFRSQTLVFEDERGQLLCLRPEMTIPVARIALDEGFRGGRRLKLSYAGSVFRLDRAGHVVQSMQAGIEDLGDMASDIADAAIMKLARDAVGRASGRKDVVIAFSDLALFHHLVEVLAPGPAQRKHLLRRFDAAGSAMFAMVENTRQAVCAPAPPVIFGAGFSAGGVEALIADSDLLCAARRPDEIRMRLEERARAREEGPLPPSARETLAAFFALSLPAREAPDGIARFFRERGLAAPDLSSFAARNVALSQSVDPALLRFDARVHAPLGYYSGLEFRVEIDGRAVAGGGRYDLLLPELLGQNDADIPAIGCAVFLDALCEFCP